MNAARVPVALLVLLMLSARAGAQTRDGGAAPANGSISGIVVSADLDATPVRKARVTCTGPGAPGRTTITDERGRFSFVDLAAGRYMITASKPTWVTTAYGATRPMRTGTAVPLAAGETLQLVLRLTRGAVITGVVTNFDNQPASAADVRALRYEMRQGERRLVDAGSATTDDRGVYRIFGLAAGDYLVAASTRSLGGMSEGELQLTSDADVRDSPPVTASAPLPSRSVALAPVFYTNGANASQANTVSIGAGEERSGIDITLQLVRTARIEGTVMLPDGGVPDFTEVNLIAQGSGTALSAAENLRRTHPGRDGAFLFSGVPPGTYELIARGSKPMSNADGSAAAAQMVWASTQVAVDGEPVNGVSLSLEPGLTIAGRIQFTASALRRPAPTAIRLALLPSTDSPVSFAPAPVTAREDGTFRITGVVPGRYRITASFPGSGRLGGWLLESIVANGGDALDAPMTVAPNQHVLDAIVTFTDHLGEIAGVVRTTSGVPADYTVVLFPEARALWLPQTRRIQATRAGSDGVYIFHEIPAGSYRMAVSSDVENGEWFDPAFLQRLLPGSVRLILGDGGHRTQDLRAERGAPRH
jgi:hypothetical protein